MKKALFSVIALLSACSVCTATQLESLTKSQTTEIFAGNTLTSIPVITMDGQLTPNAFTGYFNKDGTMEGKLAAKPKNGPRSDKGTWTISDNGTLCATWQHWNKNKPICVTAFKLTDGVLLVNDQTKNFETMLLNSSIQPGNKLN